MLARHAFCVLLIVPALLTADPTKEDSLKQGSILKGELYQRGSWMGLDVPPKFMVEMEVTKRDKDEFECVLREETPDGGKVHYRCKGTLVRKPGQALQVDFRSVECLLMEGLGSVTDVPYTATLKGDTLEGTWKYVRENENINVEGDFKFSRPK
jgi:hypothetical protein